MLPFAINAFLKPSFYCPPRIWWLQLQWIFGHTNSSPTVGSSISVFLPYHLTLLPLGIHLPFLPYLQKKIPVQPRWPSALSAWFLIFRNCLFLCPQELVLKKWPALMDPRTFKSIFPGDFIYWFLEQPEICSSHVQGWSFVGTFPPVTRDFKLDGFMIAVAKTATDLYSRITRSSPLTSNKPRRTSFQVSPLSTCIIKLSSRCFKNT